MACQYSGVCFYILNFLITTMCKDTLIICISCISPIVEVSYLLSEMVQHGLRCIAFCKTRKLCELVLAYT